MFCIFYCHFQVRTGSMMMNFLNEELFVYFFNYWIFKTYVPDPIVNPYVLFWRFVNVLGAILR